MGWEIEKYEDKEETADEDIKLQDIIDTAAQETKNEWRRMNIVLKKFHFIS